MIAAPLDSSALRKIDPDLLARVSDEVEKVEEELRHQVRSHVDLVERVGRLTLEAGGKRLRPAFVTLAARATGLPFDEDRAVRLGAVMEMIHMATLMHDDVIDGASTRRGKPTAGATYGGTAAILGGDVLLAKAMMILANDGDIEIIRSTSQTMVEIAEGEVRELEVRGDFDLDEVDHLDVLRRKTAAFIEACTEMGAHLAEASHEVRRALKDYGHHVGIAFQIVDDLLDYRGDKSQTGKEIGTDFRDGQATLPLIYLRPKMSEAESAIARRRFGADPTGDELRLIADWMDSRGAFSEAEKTAERHIAEARNCLSVLPDTPARAVLETVAAYVLERKR
ncbi:polyprenyl synthetase family protein [soil metagenome]